MQLVLGLQGQRPSAVLIVRMGHAEHFTAYLTVSGFFLIWYLSGTNTLTYFHQVFISDLALSSSLFSPFHITRSFSQLSPHLGNSTCLK